MENRKLNNGTTIPIAGIGTFMMQPNEAQQAVEAALHSGYTMIDTANAYMNERGVGRGIKASGISHENVYICTKLWPSEYADADKAIEDTLARLDTASIDLLFLHQPVGDYIGAYKAMERAVKNGKVKALGLSNFSMEQIKEVVSETSILPSVVQAEVHPYFPQKKLKHYLKEIEAVIMAWYPLGHGDKALLEEPIFTELASKYGKSNAQIIMRWHTQVGNIVIPGSKNPAHIKENIDVFDFVLSDAELAEIDKLDKNAPYYTSTKEMLDGYLHFAPDFNAQQ